MPIRRIAPSQKSDGLRVGIVLSRFNAKVGEGLLAGALRALSEAGVAEGDITVVSVPARWSRRSRCSNWRRPTTTTRWSRSAR